MPRYNLAGLAVGQTLSFARHPGEPLRTARSRVWDAVVRAWARTGHCYDVRTAVDLRSIQVTRVNWAPGLASIRPKPNSGLTYGLLRDLYGHARAHMHTDWLRDIPPGETLILDPSTIDEARIRLKLKSYNQRHGTMYAVRHSERGLEVARPPDTVTR